MAKHGFCYWCQAPRQFPDGLLAHETICERCKTNPLPGLIAKLSPVQARGFALRMAERALRLFQTEQPDDDRCEEAVKLIRLYYSGRADFEDHGQILQQARDLAYSAYQAYEYREGSGACQTICSAASKDWADAAMRSAEYMEQAAYTSVSRAEAGSSGEVADALGMRYWKAGTHVARRVAQMKERWEIEAILRAQIDLFDLGSS